MVKLIRVLQFQFKKFLLPSFVAGDPEGEHSGCEIAVDPSDAAADPGLCFNLSDLGLRYYIEM